MKLDLIGTALGYQRWKTDPFDRQVFGVLEAENRGDAEFLSEPRDIFDSRVFADKKGREDFAYLRPSRAVIRCVMRRKRVVKARHVGKVEKVRGCVKIQHFSFLQNTA
jgi:hypothetical protein